MTMISPARSALRPVTGPFPFEANLNAYGGCAHGCRYCFAQGLGRERRTGREFFADPNGKAGLAEALDRELSQPRWKGKLVNLGSVSDSYQPMEKDLAQMPAVWKVLSRHRNPVVISTKSDLILRDLEAIGRHARQSWVHVAITLITPRDDLAALLEPGASLPGPRLAIIREIRRETRARTGIHIMPMIPGLTDGVTDLGELLASARDAGVHDGAAFPLHLHGVVRPRFLAFIDGFFPHLSHRLRQAYPGPNLRPDLHRHLMAKIAGLWSRHPIAHGYLEDLAVWRERSREQLLFPMTPAA